MQQEDKYLKFESLIKEKVFTVSQFLDFLNQILKPCQVVVKGEVGEKINDYRKRNGFVYFNLLDEKGSKLSCSAFRTIFDNLGIELRPGLEIKVIGYPEIIKKWGILKFQVQRIELFGKGVLKKQFDFLKKRLALLGYFDQERKKPIPEFCQNIGLITSQYGRGAKKDFLTNLGNFGFNIFFYDVRVEGSFALNDILKAIDYFNKNYPYLDVLTLIRGGGDWESLQPFNTEEIVKAISASRIPIITGIGHEDDTTLADLASDLRTSTPTHAAKILNESWQEAFKKIDDYKENINLIINKMFKIYKESLNRELNNELFKIAALIRQEKIKVKQILNDLIKNQIFWKKRINDNLKNKEEKLIISGPTLKLKQGYSITYDSNGNIIKDLSKIKMSQEIKTKLYKGRIFSEIKKIDT